MPTENQRLEQRVAALQSDLNRKDEQIDALTFSDNDRELSRRDWFDEAQRLQNELDKRPSQIAMSLQTKIKNLQAKLAERDALLRSWMNIPRAASSPEPNEVRRKTDYLLSASAEPKSCGACANAVAARVCAYTPGLGQVELKLPGALPSWPSLGEVVTVQQGGAQRQGEPVAMVRTHGSVCWEEITGESLELCQAQPEEYEVRILYTRPAEQPAQKYDDTLLPFMELMRRELHANSHKGDRPEWLKMTSSTALEEIAHHFNKLDEAVGARDNPQIREYAADIANICMMLLDICGELSFVEHPAPVAVASDKQVVPVRRDWLEEWAMELVLAAQDGGTMSNQVEHLLQLHPKQ